MTQLYRATMSGDVPLTEEEIQEINAMASQSAAEAAHRRWESIKAIRDRKTQVGGYKVDGNWYHSDTFSRTQQMGLVMMGAGVPAGLQWKTMGGNFVAMTPALALQIFQAAAQQDAAIFAHAEALRANASLPIDAGWPETFAGL